MESGTALNFKVSTHSLGNLEIWLVRMRRKEKFPRNIGCLKSIVRAVETIASRKPAANLIVTCTHAFK